MGIFKFGGIKLFFHTKTSNQVLTELNSSRNGLSTAVAEELLIQNGKNELTHAEKDSLFKKFLQQFKDPMIIILLVVAVIAGALGEITDCIIIMAVVILNSALGVFQENKAEKAIEALQQMSSPYAKTLRDGSITSVKSENLVVGDVVLLEAGDFIPADLRIFESASLKIEEAALTGESIAVDKNTEVLENENLSLGDRTNMVYMGTSVVYGRGMGIVIATGMQTEIGKIADSIANTEESITPLQKKMSELSKILTILVMFICAIVFALGIWHEGWTEENVVETFLTAISLAVSAIPEGLVVVVTIVLSIGVTRMAKRHAIIRKLPAVETLGCAQIICSDKTGTLTQNNMTVVQDYTTAEGIELLDTAMALCSDASVAQDSNTVVGEPTEKALVEKALKDGFNKNQLTIEYPRIAEIPFDSERKLMSTIHKTSDGKIIQFTKGAPDELLKNCQSYQAWSEIKPLTNEQITIINRENKNMADSALRVIGAAYRILDQEPTKDTCSPELLEKELIFIGLQGMIDPVRPEVIPAIEKCKDAGIRPIMITGDHKDTAIAIGKDIKIIDDPSQAITGEELDQISDEEFAKGVQKYSVYARVQPKHKVRVVKAWKKLGKVTAMTGDGVNDAPALKTADIGIGMGITGTDVSKSVSAMVLSDDNFSSIVAAVEEGRIIYSNIKKATQFLLSTNATEVMVIFSAMLIDIRLLAPVQLLWINMVTDSLPAIAIGMEKGEKEVMEQPPRDSNESIFANGLAYKIIYQSLIMSALVLFAYSIGDDISHEVGHTMAFLTLSAIQLFHAFNLRFEYHSLFNRESTHNKYMYFAFVVGLLATLIIIYTPGLNTMFKTVPISSYHALLSIGISFLIIPIVELFKIFRRVLYKV